MKTSTLLFTLMAGLLLLSSCRPGNRTNGNGNAIATTNGGACPTGNWYTGGMCYSATGTTNSAFSYSNGFYADNYSGTSSLTITDSTKMTEFFKLGMGICDRAATNGGLASCSTYLSGYVDFIIQFPPQMNGNALITVIAQPKPSYVNYSYQGPSGLGLLGIALGYATGYTIPDPSYYQGAYRNPLQIQAVVSAINNSAGFAAQGYGDAWTGLNQTVVAIEAASGSANSTSFNYTFKVGGVVAAKGKMTRCQTVNCGL